MGHILVVDDYPANRELLSRRMRRLGHTVVEAENGAEALKIMKQEPFDLLLLDILMPVMSGYDVLEVMKDDPVLNEVPVIVISAVEETESVVRCIELGAADYLTKPFNPVVLNARVHSIMEKKELRVREQAEKKRADDLLCAIFPEPIAEELKMSGSVVPRYYEDTAILFCDIVDFTEYCKTHSPEDVVANLQTTVELFENVAAENNTLKIKTNGDSFMCVAGIFLPTENPVLDCVRCGLEMIEKASQMGTSWEIRIGIHTGPAMAGIVGHRQYLFDVWGDTVNIASRLAEQGSIGHVTLSEQAMQRIRGQYETISIGKFPIKGIGNTELYRVTTPRTDQKGALG